MMTFDEVLARIDPLDADELTLWIEQQWILPARRSGRYEFNDMDMARLRLIHDIRYTFELDTSAVPLMLSLLDQVYDNRRQVRALLDAIRQEPEAVQRSIFKRVGAAHSDSGNGKSN